MKGQYRCIEDMMVRVEGDGVYNVATVAGTVGIFTHPVQISHGEIIENIAGEWYKNEHNERFVLKDADRDKYFERYFSEQEEERYNKMCEDALIPFTSALLSACDLRYPIPYLDIAKKAVQQADALVQALKDKEFSS